jgi:cystathionine beta-lyase
MLTERGTPVAFLTPAYPPFFVSVSSLRRPTVEVPMADGASTWSIDVEALDAAVRSGAAAILLCNPHNPTGRRFSRDELLAVAAVADRYGVPVVSDEIHAPLVLDPAAGPHIPFGSLDAEAARRSVCFHSASKGWNVAGLKAAVFAAGSAALAEQLASPQLDHRSELTGTAGIAASIAAFDEGEPWLDELIGYLAGNHRVLQERLPEALPDARVTAAEAGFLAWLDLRDVRALRGEPAAELLARARVALVPGARFGADYARWARINVGTSRAIVTEAIERIGGLG